MTKTIFVVIYSTDRMRERHFQHEEEQLANDFAKEVKGSVCPMTVKVKKERKPEPLINVTNMSTEEFRQLHSKNFKAKYLRGDE